MNNKTKSIISSLFLTLLSISLIAQEKNDKEVRRMFLYHFINYIEWPNEASNKSFRIAVFNDEKMYNTLYSKMHGSKRKGKNVVIEKIDNESDLKKYQVVFLGRSSSKLLENFIEKTYEIPTLLITDRNGLGDKGSNINFKEEGSKLKFEINMKVITEKGLKVANQLKKVGILI